VALTWLLAIARSAKVKKGSGEGKEECAYLTIASVAQVLKTLTNSLECQVGTFSSIELDWVRETKTSGGLHVERTRAKPMKGCPPSSIRINHYRLE